MVTLCQVLFGIVEVFRGGIGEHFVEIFPGRFPGRFEIHEGVVAAVAGSGAGDIPLERGHEFHSLAHQWDDVGAFELALKQKIITCAAAHRPPVNHLRRPLGMIAQECGGEMFHGVEGTGHQCFLSVGKGHPDVESGYHVARGGDVAAAHEDAALKAGMVDGETGYFFHIGSKLCGSEQLNVLLLTSSKMKRGE